LSIVECVPNFSEGRRSEVIDEIAGAAREAGGAYVLDLSSDPDHNRSVLTLAGDAPAVVNAVLEATRVAVARIDLRVHEGTHPRMGAMDVVPFVALDERSESEIMGCATGFALRAWSELGVPCYFYGRVARDPDRRELPKVRGKGFEELLTASVEDPARKPDVGGPGIHPTAGAIAVGVRPPLIAYNVNLASTDLALAKRIANRIRERDGGLPGVRALGMALEERGMVQVSMNLVDYRRTPPAGAFAAVAAIAAEQGVDVVESEVVGLIPKAALEGTSPEELKVRDWRDDLVLETRLARVMTAKGGPGGTG